MTNTELNDNRNDSVCNNNENPHELDQQNCVRGNAISSEYTPLNFEITTKDVLNTLNDMKANKGPGPDNIYQYHYS